MACRLVCLKYIEDSHYSEYPVNFYLTTRHHNPESHLVYSERNVKLLFPKLSILIKFWAPIACWNKCSSHTTLCIFTLLYVSLCIR